MRMTALTISADTATPQEIVGLHCIGGASENLRVDRDLMPKTGS